VTRPLAVTLERTGSGPGMKGEYRAGFETTFEIKRSDFGMTQLLGGVGDDVRLIVSVEATRQ
jgi:polyisoprenoid-binding protein YceI